MTREQTIEKIARDHLRIETLASRNSDRLDFHELGVWTLAQALDAAYRAGSRATLEAAEAEPDGTQRLIID